MLHTIRLLLVVAIWGTAASAWGQTFGELNTKGAKLGPELRQLVQVGVIVTADSGPCQGIKATIPIPIDWAEQRVVIDREEFSPLVRDVSYRIVGGTVKQMLIEIPFVPAGEECRALMTLEVTRHTLLPPDDTSRFVIADEKKLPRDVRVYLGPSPYIESTSPKIKSLAREATSGKTGGWEQVEALYDITRERVKYENGPLKGALAALRDGTGDCEELSSLFIALCRATGIPARTVWVPDHCYPEFYLQDEEGNGYWFPCQAAGTRDFGGIPETRPILQKGDNFTVPEKPRDKQRYVAEHLTGTGGKPRVKFVCEVVGSK